MWKKRDGNGSRSSGSHAEKLARDWLAQRGLHFIAGNYRCKVGEIDLVMRDGDTLVFIEVRYRKQNQYGSSIESVDWRKQKKLVSAAKHFLASRGQYGKLPCRFDVMAASPAENSRQALIWHWIKNAFGL